MKFFYSTILFTLLSFVSAHSQDPYTGTWEGFAKTSLHSDSARISLQIGTPHNNLLYPSRLMVSFAGFSGDYDVLLVKKNIRQLATGKHKHPFEETPFSLGNYTAFLNGTFDFSRDNRGQFTLSANRLQKKNLGLSLNTPKDLVDDAANLWKAVTDIFQHAEIKLIKKDTIAWDNVRAENIFKYRETGNYFGIVDTIFTDARDGDIRFYGKKKSNTGVVSAAVNGKAVFDYTYLTEGWPVNDFRLDTGINYLAFYAEDYGKTTATTGTMEVDLNGKKKLLDFNIPDNLASTFIIAPIYSNPPYQNLDSSQDVIIRSLTELAGLNNEMVYYYPRSAHPNPNQKIRIDTETEKTLTRNSTVVDNIQAATRQVLLAIWDDAVEDGDSISLNINGQWVVQGMPVRKRPQFISVTLDPGVNRIVFIADNEGGIPPNTSILEIIDGTRRRSYKIDTDMSRNNLVNILYQLKE